MLPGWDEQYAMMQNPLIVGCYQEVTEFEQHSRANIFIPFIGADANFTEIKANQLTTRLQDLFEKIKDLYKNQPINAEDGLKIEFDNDWVHLRTSNTEPIIRIYAESDFESKADNIAKKLMQDIGKMM